jgi:hypothetical protein
MRANILALAVCGLLGSITVPAQQTYLYPRDDIERWPELQKQKLLPFLDECRLSADQFLAVWRTGDVNAIYANVHPEQLFSRADFDRLMGQLNLLFGSIRTAKYRNDAVVLLSGDTIELLRRPYAEIEYAITTTKWPSSELFFKLDLSRAGGPCRVMSFKIHKYLNYVPDYLERRKNKEGT